MKILVTGGAGFVGSHLCERLSQNKNYHIFSLDNYFTGSTANHVPNVHYIVDDTRNIHKLGFIPDMIYHLGEYSRVEQSFDDMDKVIEYNKTGTLAVLEFARKYNIRILYAGSSTKFGDNTSNSSPYAWSKESNTQLFNNYGKWFGLNYAITYFYNVYGDREIESGKYATLIALFINKSMKGEDLTVVAPGTQLRNFTHVSDIIDGLVLVGENGVGDNYGIGSDEKFSILEIAKMFGGDITMLPARAGNRMSAEVITEKTKALGWEAKIKIKNYIEGLV
jgi:UDP-glucose 4-epimerase